MGQTYCTLDPETPLLAHNRFTVWPLQKGLLVGLFHLHSEILRISYQPICPSRTYSALCGRPITQSTHKPPCMRTTVSRCGLYKRTLGRSFWYVHKTPDHIVLTSNHTKEALHANGKRDKYARTYGSYHTLLEPSKRMNWIIFDARVFYVGISHVYSTCVITSSWTIRISLPSYMIHWKATGIDLALAVLNTPRAYQLAKQTKATVWIA